MTFDLGKETVGLLKAVEHELLPYYRQKIEGQEHKRKNGKFYWVCDNVSRFDVCFYLPLDVMNSRDARVVDVLIMVNGLNETYNIYYPHYDRLGTALATRGIGAMLHPSPFHLNRTPYLADTRYSNAYLKKFGPRKPDPLGTGRVGRPPHRALLSDDFTIFYCFQQLSNELIALAEFLTGKRTSIKGEGTEASDEFFYDRFFDRSRVRLNLLGYSLGGLQVLYALLRRPDLFGACVLVNSGASLKELRPKPVGISDDEWERIVNNALKASDQIPKEIPTPDRQLLWEVLFSRPFLNTDTAKRFADNVDRLLFVAGAADIVAPAEMVTQFVRKEHLGGKGGTESFQGLNILQLSGLEHPLTNSLAYDRWFSAIVDVVEKFIRRPRRREVSYRDIMATLGNLGIKEMPWYEWINKNRTSIYDPDGNFDVDKVAASLAEPSEKVFKEAYLNSKRYFENDSELVRTLTRKGGRGRP